MSVRRYNMKCNELFIFSKVALNKINKIIKKNYINTLVVMCLDSSIHVVPPFSGALTVNEY